MLKIYFKREREVLILIYFKMKNISKNIKSPEKCVTKYFYLFEMK